jgi:hypothetical protein
MKIYIHETTYQPWDDDIDELEYETSSEERDVDDAREAIEVLREEGLLEPSCWPPCQNSTHCWLTTVDMRQNYRTGETIQKSFHLEGFSPGTHGRIVALFNRR